MNFKIIAILICVMFANVYSTFSFYIVTEEEKMEINKMFKDTLNFYKKEFYNNQATKYETITIPSFIVKFFDKK